MSKTKTLYVLRHAKSSWDEMDKNDFDRALKSRGIDDARKLAHIHRNELSDVDIVVSSPANRAIHTAILFCQTIGLPMQIIHINENIYESYEDEIERIVRAFPDEVSKAIIVGHNPTFTYFANRFLPNSIENIPTSGIVKLEFSAKSWENIAKNNLVSHFFDYPKNY